MYNVLNQADRKDYKAVTHWSFSMSDFLVKLVWSSRPVVLHVPVIVRVLHVKWIYLTHYMHIPFFQNEQNNIQRT